ncbi:MAG: hypothetical protein DBP03_18465 [gamma proteobacterium symbiont of Ctena orbiculata]|nr:MAG: hypothetical protein DBP03_18465 [gamma proteobacterium symbiont of Ctena orbiculata]
MVTVKGRMGVNVINGRNGQFSVATLYSEIGDFVLRYEGLDQYDAGTYEGEFVIRDMCLKARPFGVSQIIEPLAFIEDLMLKTADESLQEPLPDAIPDPVADASKSDLVIPLDIKGKSGGTISEVELKQLFGSLWSLGDKVKLDPTIGRPIFRAQKDYLNLVGGYEFDPTTQIWDKLH